MKQKTKKLPTEYVNVNNKEYILFKNDCGVTDVTRQGGVYEEHIFQYIRNNINIEGKNIIDIGANFGSHSLQFADLVGADGHVYSFEPQKLIFYQLAGNIILNGYDNITAYNIALSDESTTLLMENLDYYSKNTINIGNAHLNAYTVHASNVVKVEPLDFYKFKNVGIIKIDVQGYEPKVLDGAIATIQENRPIIFIEVELDQLSIYKFNEEDIFSRLKSLNYTLEKIATVDYVAIPNEIILDRAKTKLLNKGDSKYFVKNVSHTSFPKVSCVMCTYRRFTVLHRTIAAFLAQDYEGEKELIIYNTDEEYPLELDDSLKNKNIKIINNNIDHQTHVEYTNIGAIRRDSLNYATGSYYICWDDDDIFLPWNIRQGVDYILETGKKAFKPIRSFFARREEILLQQNTLEASIVVDINEVRDGFHMTTGSEHLKWYDKLKNIGELDENNTNSIPAYCFNWGDPPEMKSGHKQSGSMNAPNNFENHKEASKDFATSKLTLMDLTETYKPYYEFFVNHKEEFNEKYYNKYFKPYDTV